MHSRYSELFKNTGVITVANFSSKILVFLLVPLYTSVLTKDDYGLTDLIFVTVQLVTPIFTLNIADSVLRFSIENSKDTKKILSVALNFTLISLLPLASLLAIMTLLKSYDTTKIHWSLIIIYYFSYALNQVFPTYAKGIGKIKDMAISGVIGTISTVVSCIVFLLVFKNGINGFFVSNILGQLLPVIYLFFRINVIGAICESKGRDRSLERKMLKYSIPLILTNIGWWINNTSDRYIITYLFDVGLNGLLSVAYKIPSILSITSGLFIQAWQISAMKEYEKKGSKDFFETVFIYLNVFMFFVTFGLIFLTKILAHFAFQKEFYNAWIFVPFLLVSSMFTANAGFLAPIITSSYNTKDVALSTIYGAIVNVILNVLLLKAIGPQGVAIATAFSGFVIFLYRYHALKGLISISVFLKMSVAWIILTIQCFFEIISLWWGEILLLILAIVFFRKEIQKLIVRANNLLIR